MPKFTITAYEEVYYKATIEAKDEDEAYELFTSELGEYHPYQYQHNFQVTGVKKISQPKKKELDHA
jgi:hypothetical protein